MSKDRNVGILKELIWLNGGDLHSRLVEDRQDVLERLANAPGDDFKTLQGEAKVLGRLIKEIDGAKSELTKLEKTRPNMNKVF